MDRSARTSAMTDRSRSLGPRGSARPSSRARHAQTRQCRVLGWYRSRACLTRRHQLASEWRCRRASGAGRPEEDVAGSDRILRLGALPELFIALAAIERPAECAALTGAAPRCERRTALAPDARSTWAQFWRASRHAEICSGVVISEELDPGRRAGGSRVLRDQVVRRRTGAASSARGQIAARLGGLYLVGLARCYCARVLARSLPETERFEARARVRAGIISP